LTRDEFERRYAATPDVKKAELIEGTVYMPSPVSQKRHSNPHSHVVTWLGLYEAATPGVEMGADPSLRLDMDNEPQPDALLMVKPQHGGQAKVGEDGDLEGAPELVAEVAASSASYDLHDKKRAYRRNGVKEYIVWRVLDEALDWFILRRGQYEALQPDAAGLLRSEVFPGLWLDPAALLNRDLATVLKRLQDGLASPEHEDFVARLKGAAKPSATL
jgi:Uma2 family endonuclease